MTPLQPLKYDREVSSPESLNVSRDDVEVLCYIARKKNQQYLYDDCISRYHDNKSKILKVNEIFASSKQPELT